MEKYKVAVIMKKRVIGLTQRYQSRPPAPKSGGEYSLSPPGLASDPALRKGY